MIGLAIVTIFISTWIVIGIKFAMKPKKKEKRKNFTERF